MFAALMANAQKKEIAAARTNIKSGKNLEQTEQNMRKLLQDSTLRMNEKVWLLCFDAIRKQYEQGNEKLYLKQSYDTAKLFVLNRKMFLLLEGFDSISSLPDKDGVVKLTYRKKHADFLSQYRPNLFNAGLFFIKKQQYDQAYNFFETYLNCVQQPLFNEYNYYETDSLLPEAAYWAVYCGWKMKKTKETLRYSYLALKDKEHYCLMLQYLADTYLMEQDTNRYVKTLQEGYRDYPKFPFFFPRLVKYYSDMEEWQKVMDIAFQLIEVDNESQLAHHVLTTSMVNLRRYDECIALCDSLICQKKDSTAVLYYNAGISYYRKAIEIDKQLKLSAKAKKTVKELYRKSLPYLEQYRRLEPRFKEMWGLPLYTIYLNLNMGNEFDEISKIL